MLFNFSFLAVHAEYVPSKTATLKGVEFIATPEMKTRFKSYFVELTGKPWDILNFKIKIDQITKELFSGGYFSSKVKMEMTGTESEVIVKISIIATERINFHFRGNTLFSHQELRKNLIDKVKNDFGKSDQTSLGNYLVDVYEGAGFYNTSVKSYQNEGRDLDGVTVRNYFFEIDEGEKLNVSLVHYRGNIILGEEEFHKLFKKNASGLALAGYYDKTFFENYSNIIKKDYLSKGFVFAEVSKPRVATNDDDESLSIEYGISEKQQVILKAITFNNVDPQLQPAVKQLLVNKEGEPFNVVELENDLKKIISHFQEQGYYFTSIANLNDENLLIYDKSFTSVELHPQIITGKKVCFNEASVSGNVKTRSQVVFREIEMKPGDLLTPGKLENLRQKLSGLGLFSTLRLTPNVISENAEKSCTKTNIAIQVKEKDFGLFEVAPGYRTDLGMKLSTGITYNNFMGMNRSASVKLQGNLRDNLDGFTDQRKLENKKLLEYLGKVSYIEPYLLHNILNTQLELETTSSFQRKRFPRFDADIFRISPQLSKNITKSLSASLKYQFERIVQFDGSAIDNDNFSIGGITPSLTFDKRNDPINPRDGYYLNLSSEWANNYFGSMKNADLEVNYIKIISRNKFYYPVGDFTFAMSLAMGYEKNFAVDLLRDANGNVIRDSDSGIPRTHGYIPGIKVFQLDGYDEIRGYDESEINRLRTGYAIGRVQGEAYFTAFKFEPRYNITDTIQTGIFFDAGRISVDEFTPFDLRTSVGAGLKFLTPVGSLDFDYGFKLQRKTYPDNKRDSVGRFHLSIGFF